MIIKNIKLIIVSIVIGCLTIAGYWIYNNFKLEKVSVDIQTEAANDPLLAAKQLLERMKTPVVTIQNLPKDELDSQDTLILLQYNSILNEKNTQQLLEWVDSGGNLIIVSDVVHDNTQDIVTQPDLLLSKLNIFQYQNESPTKAEPVGFIWQKYKLKVLFDPNYYLTVDDNEPAQDISDNYGSHLLQYYYGTGIIIILSDLSFIENDKIATYDHAQFLWHLTHFERQETKVWFLNHVPKNIEGGLAGETNNWNTSTKMPTLLTLIWTHMWTVVISAIILLLFWLWSVSQRFGPLIPISKPIRRRLLEHIEASGNFLWRQGKTATLLNDARQSLIQQINRTHPNWNQLSYSQLSNQLAQRCGLSATEIEDALSNKNTDLVQTIQIFSKIRKTL